MPTSTDDATTLSARPSGSPSHTGNIDWRITMPTTFPWVAPTAMRIPISRVRLLTAYDTNPYKPTIVSAIPIRPMPAIIRTTVPNCAVTST